MKQISLLTLAFFFVMCNANCQKSASDYIAMQLANTRLGDSCFSGFYFVKFSIGENTKTKDIHFSSEMPIILQSGIRQRLDSSLQFLERSFIESAIKKKKQLLIPVLCVYNVDCKLKGNKYLDDLNLDSTGTDRFKYNLLNASIRGFAESQNNLKNSFGKSMIFEPGKKDDFFDGIVLDPCMIVRKPLQGDRY